MSNNGIVEIPRSINMILDQRQITDALLTALDDLGIELATGTEIALVDRVIELLVGGPVDFRCRDCGVNTDEIDEYYMVTDDVWAAANGGVDDMLCIGCLEERLGRQLTPADFTDLMINVASEIHGSARLRDRLGMNDGTGQL